MAYADQPQDLVSRLRRVEAELADLRRKVGLSSATIRRGGLRLLDDAFFEVISADGDRVARIGELGTFPDGSSQQGVDLRYQNGTSALRIHNPAATDPDDDQFLAIFNGAQIVMSTDANSGFGIARPWLPISFEKARITDWPSTVSGSYENVVEAFTHQQHPWFEARVSCNGNPGTTGDCRVMVAGSQVGDPVVFDGTTPQTVFRSARIFQTFGTLTQVMVEARRLTGVGTIFVKIDAWWRQT